MLETDGHIAEHHWSHSIVWHMQLVIFSLQLTSVSCFLKQAKNQAVKSYTKRQTQ